MRFVEVVIVACIGVAMLVVAAFLPSGDDTHRNVVTMIASGGAGFCGAAIAMWTNQQRGAARDRKTDVPPEYVAVEVTKQP